ncbi:MAG: ABC transporter substrate-binding protein [Promethearchaeota archaeon]
MEKKNVAIIILVIALVASGVGNIVLLVQSGFVQIAPPPEEKIIKFGTMYIVRDADPQFAWDSASSDFIYQIWEALYAYNFSDPQLKIIPRLASDYGTLSPDGKNYTVPLRENVYFQDGTPFNATAVKFSFDRLAFLMNLTGTLPPDNVYGIPTIVSELYEWPDGTPIINRTEIVDTYTIKFVLNKPYGPFLPLLTFTASFILSPKSTPSDDYISMATASSENCVGTGPFVLEKLRPGIEVRFKAFDNYWQGRPKIDKLIMLQIKDSDARNLALLTGSTDIMTDPNPSYYPDMEADPNLVLYNDPRPSAIIQYIGMNNKLINKTWREAISYAVNYSYIINEVMEGYAKRMTSVVPPAIAFHNGSFNYPVLNITHAREVIQSMGFGTGWDPTLGGSNEDDWKGATFMSLNYTFNTGNQVREDIGTVLKDTLDLIGIELELKGIDWGAFLDRLYGEFDKLQLYFIGWMPDYNDPSNFINPLFHNTSSSNSAQVNDPYLEDLMAQGLEETDTTKRMKIYWEIQRYLVEELRPWVFVYYPMNHDAYRKDLKGFPSNPMGYTYFYPCYYE